jgi:O-antigen/teichoic acid export membrane protein
MAVVMLMLNVLLIPRWGIVGAAIAAAITNMVANGWYLTEVRRSLHLSPYNRSFLRLTLPLIGMLMVLLLWRARLSLFQPEWAVIGIGLALAYLTFIGFALIFGLDTDDQLIARAVWSRIRSVFPDAEANA